MKLNKFGIDVIVNYLSLGLLAGSGVLINVIIVKTYDASALGQFNLVYAFYILLSQFSALGVHYSVLRHLALIENQTLKLGRQIVSSALGLVLLLGLVMGASTYLAAPLAGFFYDSYLVDGLKAISFALPLFALNKVLLSVFNGKRFMRLFALGQGCRYLFMLLFVIWTAYVHGPIHDLFNVFLVAEFLLSAVLTPLVLIVILKGQISFSSWWFKKHFQFGCHAFLAGVFLEVNSRIDVILLAGFVNSAELGAYSFAAMVAEGFAMMLVVLRNNVNPILAQLISEKKYSELAQFIVKTRNYTYVGMATVISFTLLAYYGVIHYVLPTEVLWSSWPVLIILSVSVATMAGYLPFADFLIQANYPKSQSLQNLMVVALNIALNLMLSPIFGIIGAAIAAGLSSYVFSMLLVDYLARGKGLVLLWPRRLVLRCAS